jgi:hypothetical protein
MEDLARSLWRRLINSFPQRFAYFEVSNPPWGNAHTLATARIASDLCLTVKLPNPRTSMHWPRSSESLIAPSLTFTAASTSRCVGWSNRAASSATRSERVIRVTVLGWGINRSPVSINPKVSLNRDPCVAADRESNQATKLYAAPVVGAHSIAFCANFSLISPMRCMFFT